MLYFGGTVTVVLIMFQRVRMLRMLMKCTHAVLGRTRRADQRISAAIEAEIASINEQPIVFFAHSDALSELNKAVLYVRENEQCNRLIVAHVWDSEEGRQVTVGAM